MTVYDRIRFMREQQGMSQQELANKVGFKTSSAVNKIELGKRDINQSKLLAFANALDTTPAYLMGWEDDPSPKSTDEQLLELVDLLSDEQKASLIEFIKNIAKK